MDVPKIDKSMFRQPEWIRRRWLEFRMGYSTYLAFIFAFSNFLLIAYQFAPQIKDVLPFHYFAAIFGVIVVPLAVYIGWTHNRKQLPIESQVQSDNSPYRTKMQPASKEELNNRFAIFNIKYSLWNQRLTMFNQRFAIFNQNITKYQQRLGRWELDGRIWNYKYNAKSMDVLNALIDKHDLKVPKFDKEYDELKIFDSEAKEFQNDLDLFIRQLPEYIDQTKTYLKQMEEWNVFLTQWENIFSKLQTGEQSTVLINEVPDESKS